MAWNIPCRSEGESRTIVSHLKMGDQDFFFFKLKRKGGPTLCFRRKLPKFPSSPPPPPPPKKTVPVPSPSYEGLILFRYAPHYGIIMHTSYLPTGQRSRLKEVIEMQISSDINPRRRRDNQLFLSCFTRSASSFIFICFTFLGFAFAFSRVFLVRLLTCFLFVALLILLASVAYLALDS